MTLLETFKLLNEATSANDAKIILDAAKQKYETAVADLNNCKTILKQQDGEISEVEKAFRKKVETIPNIEDDIAKKVLSSNQTEAYKALAEYKNKLADLNKELTNIEKQIRKVNSYSGSEWDPQGTAGGSKYRNELLLDYESQAKNITQKIDELNTKINSFSADIKEADNKIEAALKAAKNIKNDLTIKKDSITSLLNIYPEFETDANSLENKKADYEKAHDNYTASWRRLDKAKRDYWSLKNIDDDTLLIDICPELTDDKSNGKAFDILTNYANRYFLEVFSNENLPIVHGIDDVVISAVIKLDDPDPDPDIKEYNWGLVLNSPQDIIDDYSIFDTVCTEDNTFLYDESTTLADFKEFLDVNATKICEALYDWDWGYDY